jgi:hypothetical protein
MLYVQAHLAPVSNRFGEANETYSEEDDNKDNQAEPEPIPEAPLKPKAASATR